MVCNVLFFFFVCFLFFFCLLLFFFQAEDGIRDLVRSRGLGDVYKRQGPFIVPKQFVKDPQKLALTFTLNGKVMQDSNTDRTVSYTHLTLPTSDLV